MTMKCVHKGCGKVYTDETEPCVYHPGPPEFHEGQKGVRNPHHPLAGCHYYSLCRALTVSTRLEMLQTSSLDL